MHRKVNTKSVTKFNPGLALIGLSGTGPWTEIRSKDYASISILTLKKF